MSQSSSDSIKSVQIELKADKLNLPKIQALLKYNGFDVVSTKELTIEKVADIDTVGESVVVNKDIAVRENIVMKTSKATYEISEVILPKGYVGVISGKKGSVYTVSFDANLPIEPFSVTRGYDGAPLTYLLDTAELSATDFDFVRKVANVQTSNPS